MDIFFDILSWIFIVSGTFFVFTGAVGILRMPDFFTRLHPAGISDSIGLPLLLLGLLFHMEFGLISLKILLLIIFSMTTSATSCHALAKAAFISGVKPIGKNLLNKKSAKTTKIAGK